MARFDYSSYLKKEGTQKSFESKDFKVGFFSLKEDGDEAVVRFAQDSTEQFHLVTVHSVEVDGKFRRVSCLRTGREPLSKCPLCESKDANISRVHDKMYVKLIQYTTDASGHVVAQAKVWERPAYFSKTLESYFREYGPLSESVFKIKRHGKKGDTKTTYDILYANPVIYKSEIYVKDFSAFDDFAINKFFYNERTADEMRVFLQTGKFPEKTKTATEQIASAVPTATVQPVTSVAPKVEIPAEVSQPTASVVAPVIVTAPATTVTAEVETDPTSSRPRRYTY